MDPRWTRIVPDLHDAETDKDAYRDEHKMIFGHEGPADPNEKCQHPMHAQIRRAMNGATIETPFDGGEIIAQDSEYERARQERYGIVFQATRDFQKQVEEEDARERAKRAGIILP